MVIDFHTHIFPDAIADKAKASLVAAARGLYTPVTEMTKASLICRMNEWGVDLSVVQPVITRPGQFFSINNWAKEITDDKTISFGGLHPDTDDYKRDVDYIVSLGLKGIKLHPEYQNFKVDDDRMFPIYEYAVKKGLILLFHAGFDPAFAPPFKTSPKQFAHILDRIPQGDFVLAHFGGHAQWDDVGTYLAGRDVYLDTSMGFEYYGEEKFLEIAKAHGADKILFASDSPWSNTGKELEHLKALPIPEEDKNKILGLNAARLLKI